jgi:Carboxypeptidase regulatory-like domain
MTQLVRFTAPGFLYFLFLFGVPAVAAAQLVGGAIQGTVRDSQGAVLPGVSIGVRNVGTGATYEQTTDQGGHYQVLALPPG